MQRNAQKCSRILKIAISGLFWLNQTVYWGPFWHPGASLNVPNMSLEWYSHYLRSIKLIIGHLVESFSLNRPNMEILGFFEHFCIRDFDQNKWDQRLVNVIRVNGVLLPQRLCAKMNNLTLFLHQNRWLLFSRFLWHPVHNKNYWVVTPGSHILGTFENQLRFIETLD